MLKKSIAIIISMAIATTYGTLTVGKLTLVKAVTMDNIKINKTTYTEFLDYKGNEILVKGKYKQDRAYYMLYNNKRTKTKSDDKLIKCVLCK